jgi:hypothetical protein
VTVRAVTEKQPRDVLHPHGAGTQDLHRVSERRPVPDILRTLWHMIAGGNPTVNIITCLLTAPALPAAWRLLRRLLFFVCLANCMLVNNEQSASGP